MSDLYIFRSTLRDLARPKRVITALFLIAIPCLLGILWRHFMPARMFQPEVMYNTITSSLIFGFILVILAVVFATGVITQEIEQKTIVYLLTRPVPRWRIILMKFLAALIAIVLTSWIASCAVGVIAFGFGGADKSLNLLTASDMKDINGLAKKLQVAQDPVTQHLQSMMEETIAQIPADPGAAATGAPDILQNMLGETWQKTLVDGLNETLRRDQEFYDPQRFAQVPLSEETRRMIAQHPTGRALVRLNRRLLAEAYPKEIAQAPNPSERIGKDLLILPIGAMAYGALFLFLATILNRPLMYGLMFAFGWESWVPSLPGNFQKLSLMAYLRALAPHPMPEERRRGISFLMQSFNPQTISETMAWTVLVCFIVFVLLAALVIFSTNEYVPREDAE